MMTDERLAEIRARWTAATKGPWYVVGQPWGYGTVIVEGSPDPHGRRMIAECDTDFVEDRDDDVDDNQDAANADAIAHAATDVPDLIAEIERLQQRIAALDPNRPIEPLNVRIDPFAKRRNDDR